MCFKATRSKLFLARVALGCLSVFMYFIDSRIYWYTMSLFRRVWGIRECDNDILINCSKSCLISFLSHINHHREDKFYMGMGEVVFGIIQATILFNNLMACPFVTGKCTLCAWKKMQPCLSI